jgi:hypothetical protein
MKLITSSVACLLLLATVSSAINEDEPATNNTHLRSRSLQSTNTRQSDWIKSHNTAREKYQVQYGGTYAPIKWSNSLKTKAAALAKSMAKNNNCDYIPPTTSDYGINYYKSMMMSNKPAVSSIMTNWEKTLKTSTGKAASYPANGAMTQVLWSSTKYVGCAEASNGDAANMCYATVCLYAKVSSWIVIYLTFDIIWTRTSA